MVFHGVRLLVRRNGSVSRGRPVLCSRSEVFVWTVRVLIGSCGAEDGKRSTDLLV